MKRERDHSRDREKLASVDISGGYVCVWVWVSREETCLTSTQHFKYLLLHTLTRSQRYISIVLLSFSFSHCFCCLFCLILSPSLHYPFFFHFPSYHLFFFFGLYFGGVFFFSFVLFYLLILGFGLFYCVWNTSGEVRNFVVSHLHVEFEVSFVFVKVTHFS